ncbi:MAG: phenylalanine--tRNA ligase beta subunit-related protein [Bacteroidota bacterium]|nr:phenylalanine--tRNA ligase beta subunit-related protein [Bacteroidota bacterium]MDP4269322.1 phenylalanine--tRNA ligase beta subunit-related protein [Bacteroidota bacterium]
MAIEKQFIAHPEINPIGLRGIYLTIENVRNRESDSNFCSYQQQIIDNAYQYAHRLGDIKEDPILQGFRQLHERVGAPNRKNLSASENLYKVLEKRGTIPHVNLIVDIYNSISLKYKLALGAHDWDRIDGNVHLRITNGTEKFIPLGESDAKPIKPGEYSYIDDSNEVICYLDVRQIDKTKVTLDTHNVFFVVQGNANTPIPYIEDAVFELIDQVQKYCGGEAYMLSQIG